MTRMYLRAPSDFPRLIDARMGEPAAARQGQGSRGPNRLRPGAAATVRWRCRGRDQDAGLAAKGTAATDLRWRPIADVAHCCA